MGTFLLLWFGYMCTNSLEGVKLNQTTAIHKVNGYEEIVALAIIKASLQPSGPALLGIDPEPY